MSSINFKMLMLIAFANMGTGQNEEKAQNIFKNKLEIIKKATSKSNNNMDEYKINGAILFLEKVTLIWSESDGNYIGRFNPTYKDFKSWSIWFKNNKNRLYWDDNKQSVKVMVR